MYDSKILRNKEGSMNSKILHKVREDVHEQYMACAQYVDWDVRGFSNDESINAFIVQEVILQQIIDEEQCKPYHYYEAWDVIGGECTKEGSDVSHDLFCIGHPYDSGEEIQKSIGHKGEVIFYSKVYWIEESNELYDIVLRWPIDQVKYARGLKAVQCTPIIEKYFKNIPYYNREEFRHTWKFDDPEIIYETVMQYCKTMWKPEKSTDRINFENNINEFFPDGVYPEIKKKIVSEWYKGQ